MVETCQALELTATAREKSDGGTRFGMIAWPAGIENARAVPKTIITAKTGQATARPESVKASRSSAQTQLERDAEREDQRAIAPIGDMTRGQHQQHERQKLRQADQAEVERIARDRVNLPADGDRLHLHGDRSQEPRRQEAREIRIGEQPAERRARAFDQAHAAAVSVRPGGAACDGAAPRRPKATGRRR